MQQTNNVQEQIADLENRLKTIESRNTSVELNKAWETSYTRKVLLILFTYLAIALYLFFIVHINPWVNAVVPAIGFLLSTLTLPYFKKWWAKEVYKK